ncbi:flagellar basal body-associated FliL family protein [Aquibium sp. LZ166]|uniref:Flagellar protein FliL n=1 Tax=Aquibium pacificus TaxID=3153579 RepID=A0ABV3SBY9_9HYPH
MSLDATDAASQKKGPSMMVQVAVLVVLTLVAVGGGWFAGINLRGGEPAEPEPIKIAVEPLPGEAGEGAEAGHGEEGGGEDGEIKLIPRLVPMEPITTNLAAPSDIWVRMEISIVFSAPPPPDLVRTIHQDLLAYMRTVSLQQVQGASGFQHLKTDLEERAQIRSEGLATQLMIRTLLFE